MPWSTEEHALAIETYFENAASVIPTQTAFRSRSNFRPLDSVPSRNAIIGWIFSFRATCSNKYKQAAVLQVSNRSVRRILHPNLKFHRYKITLFIRSTKVTIKSVWGRPRTKGAEKRNLVDQ